jgi:DNA replication and repair protein RecF
VLGRIAPAQAGLSVEYAAAVAQRNAALRRAGAGYSSREAVEPWTERVAELGAELVAGRRQVIDLLEPLFAERAAELRLEGGRLRYDGEPPTRAELEAQLERDLERGTTSVGPHLHDVEILSGDRDLRAFGSQGEQRLSVLSLLLAEAELVREQRGFAPLLLLDDVLSELDPERRAILAGRIRSFGQTLVTTTSPAALPVDADQVVEISSADGRSRAA